jgi:hypothetical protein
MHLQISDSSHTDNYMICTHATIKAAPCSISQAAFQYQAEGRVVAKGGAPEIRKESAQSQRSVTLAHTYLPQGTGGHRELQELKL